MAGIDFSPEAYLQDKAYRAPLRDDLASFVKDTLLNHERPAYKQVRVSSVSVLSHNASLPGEQKLSLPKLEVPGQSIRVLAITHTIPKAAQTVPAKKCTWGNSKFVATVPKHRDSHTLSSRRSMSSPVSSLDGISYNPQDYCFRRLMGSDSTPRVPQQREPRRDSVLAVLQESVTRRKAQKKDTKLAYFKRIKQTPGLMEQERLAYISKHQGYQQRLTGELSSVLSPVHKRRGSAYAPPSASRSPESPRRFHPQVFADRVVAAVVGLPTELKRDSQGRRLRVHAQPSDQDPRCICCCDYLADITHVLLWLAIDCCYTLAVIATFKY